MATPLTSVSKSGKEMSLALTNILKLGEVAIASLAANGAPAVGAIEAVMAATTEQVEFTWNQLVLLCVMYILLCIN